MNNNFERAYLSALVASGLLAKHGVDHGALHADQIADRSIKIADAIMAKCGGPTPADFQDEPAPIGGPGDGGPQLQPVPPSTDPSDPQK